jgi:hypothetical protein
MVIVAIPGLPSRAAIGVNRNVFRPNVNMFLELLMRIQSTFLLPSFIIDYKQTFGLSRCCWPYPINPLPYRNMAKNMPNLGRAPSHQRCMFKS